MLGMRVPTVWWVTARCGALLGLGSLTGACSGEPPPVRQDPEICDDGIDNDNDGDIDCDDSNCGGLPCQNQGDDDDDVAPPPPLVEILFDAAECCDFDFTSSSCPSTTIGTFSVVNRSKTEDGEVDASCNAVGPETFAAIRWQVAGGNISAFLVNAPVLADSQITVTALYYCGGGIDQTFTTDCIINAAVGSKKDEYEFQITGTTVGL